ncbi:MAG: VIT1/CCC1 transporter family protein [Chryseolinea sp.]
MSNSVVMNPVDRISEVLYGLIVVLSFTGTVSVFTGHQEIKKLLWAALGCNAAWGIVDAIMFLMDALINRGHLRSVINRVKASNDQKNIRTMLAEEVDPLVIHLLHNEEINRVIDRLKELPSTSKHSLLIWPDVVNAMKIFCLVFIGTLPVALPFAFFQDVSVAMRVSNGIAIAMLFVGGYFVASYAGFRRIPTALAYVAIGGFLVFITIKLGG